jgi:uncharacterized membrane protein YccC
VLLYLLLGMLLGSVLTIDTPMPSRYVIFIPVVALLVGWAINHLMQAIMQIWGSRWPDVATGVVIGVLCAYGAANIASYLQHDTVETWSADPTGQMATYTGRYLQALPDQQYEIFFLQTPMMYYQANPLLKFLTNKSGTNLVNPVRCSELTGKLQAQQSVVVAPPGRIDELARIGEQLEEAEFVLFHNPRREVVAAVLRLNAPLSGGERCAKVATSSSTR